MVILVPYLAVGLDSPAGLQRAMMALSSSIRASLSANLCLRTTSALAETLHRPRPPLTRCLRSQQTLSFSLLCGLVKKYVCGLSTSMQAVCKCCDSACSVVHDGKSSACSVIPFSRQGHLRASHSNFRCHDRCFRWLPHDPSAKSVGRCGMGELLSWNIFE